MVTAGLHVQEAVVEYRTAQGPIRAVDRVSLEVAPGEVLALLGASGSGKSSLLRAVAGLEPLVSGRVLWGADDVTGVPTHKRGFGMVFQDGQLFSNLTVGRNVAYGLRGVSKAERKARVAELLELVGLGGYEDRKVTELSGGQAQRVALARSLAPEPHLLLLDEPLSALDRGLREHLAGVVSQVLRATHTTAIHVTHDQDEAFTVADRVAVLADGRLVAQAAPQELWRRPGSRQVAEFLGYGPFVAASVARSLGFVTDAPLVGLNDDSLVESELGVEVPIVGHRYRRGRIELDVILPDGQQGTLRVASAPQGEMVRVALDSEAVITLG